MALRQPELPCRVRDNVHARRLVHPTVDTVPHLQHFRVEDGPITWVELEAPPAVLFFCPHCGEVPPCTDSGWRYKLCARHGAQELQRSADFTRHQLAAREKARQERLTRSERFR